MMVQGWMTWYDILMERPMDMFEGYRPPSMAPPNLARLRQEQERSQEAKHFYRALKHALESFGAIEYQDLQELLDRVASEDCFVRREDPTRIKRLLEGEALVLSTEGKGYANATRWEDGIANECLTTAFLEGRMDYHGLVTVAGYDRRALSEQQITGGMDANPLHNPRVVCSVEGIIHRQDLRFLIIRVPAQRFSVAEMTEEERDEFEEWKEQAPPKRPLYLFRAFEMPRTI